MIWINLLMLITFIILWEGLNFKDCNHYNDFIESAEEESSSELSYLYDHNFLFVLIISITFFWFIPVISLYYFIKNL